MSLMELDVRYQKLNSAGFSWGHREQLHECSALLQDTLALRGSWEESGRRKALLRFADKLLRARRKIGWAEVELGTHWENRPLAAALCDSPVLVLAYPQTSELVPEIEHQIPVTGSKKVEKKQLGPDREVQLGRRLHSAA